jgi:UDP-N-acetylglucosamine 2-epimerase (non-hydrolysing)
MKIMTILGTRPEIIRLSRIIPKLDSLCDHVLVHTGQNFDQNLSDIFFKELNLRSPDYHLMTSAESFGEQIGHIIIECEKILMKEKPDRLLILGDTNSSLATIVAKRLNIPIFHMEAGNRCYDDRVPEEINRRIIDHSSDILMPYTERSRQNLLREGIAGECIFVIGNPINEVIKYYDLEIRQSRILAELELEPNRYFLVTMHRAENVDVEGRLLGLSKALDLIQRKYGIPVIVSTHPHTTKRMQSFGIIADNDQLKFMPPFGFFDFITLERNSLCVISDSGTVQEECCILGLANVTIRDVTERPETIESGGNILSGVNPNAVIDSVNTILGLKAQWVPPREYMISNVSDVVLKIIMSYNAQFRIHNS